MSKTQHPSEQVADQLRCLGGVYNDPPRVSRDASSLLTSRIGCHLRPKRSSYVKLTDGTSLPPVLSLDGTIEIIYRTSTYNIPIELHFPPRYPLGPPVIFVRPAASMMIKPNHRHVGPDGMVYMPSLHLWDRNGSHLINCVKTMSDLFGVDPPVFAKPTGGGAPSIRQSASSTGKLGRSVLSSAVKFGRSCGISLDSSGPPSYNESVSNEERIAIEAAEANTALETARAADREEESERLKTKEIRYHLNADAREIIHLRYDELRNDIHGSDRDTRALQTVARQTTYLRSVRGELEKWNRKIDVDNTKLKEFLVIIEEESDRRKDGRDEIAIIDAMVQPVDPTSGQMLRLSAENAAINDALYHLDRGLVAGALEMGKHQKLVRRLAKRQFMVKALLLKIGQIKEMKKGENALTVK